MVSMLQKSLAGDVEYLKRVISLRLIILQKYSLRWTQMDQKVVPMACLISIRGSP